MPTVVITGAGRGIGLEFARQYAAEGWRVHAAARDPTAAKQLAAVDGQVDVHRLDVLDRKQVDGLAAALEDEAVDLLINNAGAGGRMHAELGEIDYAAWEEVLRVNTLAPLRVAEAFIDHVARSERKIMAFMSSRAGSITNNIQGGRYIYRSSKAALNMVVRSLAIDLMPKGIICVALHPGWVRTDMGGPEAPLDAKTSVDHLRRLIERLEHHYSGHFLNYDGADLTW